MFHRAQHSVPPGDMVDIGTHRLYVFRQGAPAGPTVIFESGLAATSLSWSLVQPVVAQFVHCCSYDRTGLGYSDASNHPPILKWQAEELRRLLENARLPGPYILVGHSYGTLIIRAFAALWPGISAGLVLVDPVSIAAWAECAEHNRRRLLLGAKLASRGALLARLGVVPGTLALLAAGGRRVPRLIAKIAAGQGNPVIGRLLEEVQKLPPECLPAVRRHWSRPQSYDTLAKSLTSLPENAHAAAQCSIPPDLPMTILSAANATAAELQERDEWVSGCPGGKHRRLPDGGHWLQFDRPDAVSAEIRELVAGARASARLSAPA